jgi:hypothetical protein
MSVDKVLLESTISGLLILVVGTVVSFIVGAFFSVNIPSICKKWNKNNIIRFGLFLTGFFANLLCEFTGINKWYCKNGSACS